MMENGKVTVRVPATSANCGPGFDCLGLACTLYNEFTYERLPLEQGVQVVSEGQGSGQLPEGRSNLAAQSFFALWEKLKQPKTGLKITCRIRVPVSRGLGSSSTAIVAGLTAANALAGNPLTKAELVTEATKIEGHPDNVAPAILGGITVNVMEGGRVESLKIALARPLKLVVLVPDMPLPTSKARAALPRTVPHKDAVYNASRAALLVGSLMSGDYEFLTTALEDRLHQPYRLPLIPGAKEALEAARKAGAYNGIISGAGSTLMAYVPQDGDPMKVGKAMEEPFKKRNIGTTIHLLEIDSEGAKVM
ncbi:homoserine kinase [Acidaminococcus timonensis]|uniref:homoserine kinase n=1 Tax=Acidaminococcus timonensis TaxID=1871002 RepID=UPI000AC71BC9|nr:homoserine kinase [Acidaminococcus timonensis]